MMLTIKFIVRDLLIELLYWPIWWYTKGLFNALSSWVREIKGQEQRLGVRIWLKNIFTPMFGQYDWEGRIISFFMRLVQIIFRSIVLAIWAILSLALVVVWIAAPLVIIYQLLLNIVSLL